ncbi:MULTISPECIES: heme-binding protein [unclassified Sphingomonas]|uniref:heme-binding protein n=1 Tax=unclassified Sphingomonas TaxID=196159 RepID=UPI0022B48F09|nr:heme-binding protein [Sphingomonas sp. NIBR02145]WHU03470.1 heme-binding protein [Sphingomonas sp. NIBR02145]
MAFSKKTLMALKGGGRVIRAAQEGEALLGPLGLLPGVWKNEGGLEGHGWNMIALPFESEPGSILDYRLLMNQYNETLVFDLVDKGVPNRGLNALGKQADQSLMALDYEQVTDQIATADFPHSNVLGPTSPPGNTIHHEPGLWLNMLDQFTDGFDIARLSTVPHGDAVLALGRSVPPIDGPPVIPDVSGLPLKVKQDLDSRYLAPYRHFHDNPFMGLFDPVHPAALLQAANQGVDIVRTTVLDVDTEAETGGIHNIPFVVKHANASSMRSTFWIQELAEKDARGKPKLRLQYLQIVMIDFDPRTAGLPGRIVWPHISINTMQKVEDTPEEKVELLTA